LPWEASPSSRCFRGRELGKYQGRGDVSKATVEVAKRDRVLLEVIYAAAGIGQATASRYAKIANGAASLSARLHLLNIFLAPAFFA
jgi:hypothetical protein